MTCPGRGQSLGGDSALQDDAQGDARERKHPVPAQAVGKRDLFPMGKRVVGSYGERGHVFK